MTEIDPRYLIKALQYEVNHLNEARITLLAQLAEAQDQIAIQDEEIARRRQDVQEMARDIAVLKGAVPGGGAGADLEEPAPAGGAKQ